MIKIIKTSMVLLIAIVISACQTTSPYDYSKLQVSKPRSILVLPPMNDSVEVGAPYTFLSTISKPLAEKGYYVFPVAVIDTFMKENGLPTPAEMNSVPIAKLRDTIGADAVLYVHIHEWGQSYQVLSSTAVTKAYMKLVDTRTGEILWDTTAFAQQQSGDGGGGLVGALVGALVTQIMSDAVDHTPTLSASANDRAINDMNRGLLNGPYARSGQSK